MSLNTYSTWRFCGRTSAAVLALAFAVLVLPERSDESGQAFAQSSVGPVNVTPGTPDKPISFRDRLIVGLRALSKSDVAFVDNVVAKVQTGQLPQKLVDQNFFWARERASHPTGGRDHRPIIYFQPAMTLQAKKLGVTL